MPKERFIKIASEYVVSIFPTAQILDAFKYGVKKISGRGCNLVYVIENNAVTYYSEPSSWGEVHKALVSKIKKSPDFLKHVFSNIEILGKQQVIETKKFVKKIDKLNNAELNRRYQRYIKSNTEFYSYGLILPLLDFQSSTFISQELRTILRRHKNEQHFNILTTPRRDTFSKKQDIALFKILPAIKKDKELIKIFKTKEANYIRQYLKQNKKALWQKITDHTRRYAWVYYVYEGPAVREDYFIDILKDYSKRNIDPATELNKYKKEKEAIYQKQKEIIRKMPLTVYEKKIIEFGSEVVFMKAYRRELQSWSYYLLEPLLKEIARRLHLSLNQARMLLPEEITKALTSGRTDNELINRRLQYVVYGYAPQRLCITGEPGRNFIKNNIKPEKKAQLVDEFKGDIACAGKAKGTVKIINTPEDMKKMERGNILVSASTNPNLMPAIRQSAAIITDEGGLTCHAAIVSRELKIPCVVGTKIATQVLKDGDTVEVDANKGIVRKI